MATVLVMLSCGPMVVNDAMAWQVVTASQLCTTGLVVVVAVRLIGALPGSWAAVVAMPSKVTLAFAGRLANAAVKSLPAAKVRLAAAQAGFVTGLQDHAMDATPDAGKGPVTCTLKASALLVW